MDKIVEQTLLYDFYGELLTTNQKKIYELYFLDDLSLSEISEQEGVSRQGIHDTLKRCKKSLDNYENKLHLVKKFEENKKRVSNIYNITSEVLDKYSDNKKIVEDMDKILSISEKIICDV